MNRLICPKSYNYSVRRRAGILCAYHFSLFSTLDISFGFIYLFIRQHVREKGKTEREISHLLVYFPKALYLQVIYQWPTRRLLLTGVLYSSLQVRLELPYIWSSQLRSKANAAIKGIFLIHNSDTSSP